ncbi:MAG: hypothetical protein AVDCRST_MAG25-2095, partial [uncultured Rubrobacteraceae bacterium]
ASFHYFILCNSLHLADRGRDTGSTVADETRRGQTA